MIGHINKVITMNTLADVSEFNSSSSHVKMLNTIKAGAKGCGVSFAFFSTIHEQAK
jgi:hypothetical protein